MIANRNDEYWKLDALVAKLSIPQRYQRDAKRWETAKL